MLLIIFGSGFAGDIKILASTSGGEKLGKIGTGITYLFGAMGIFAGVIGLLVGCLYTKAEKCSKICACFVSFNLLHLCFINGTLKMTLNNALKSILVNIDQNLIQGKTILKEFSHSSYN